jgi:hypothetical protein
MYKISHFFLQKALQKPSNPFILAFRQLFGWELLTALLHCREQDDVADAFSRQADHLQHPPLSIIQRLSVQQEIKQIQIQYAIFVRKGNAVVFSDQHFLKTIPYIFQRFDLLLPFSGI